MKSEAFSFYWWLESELLSSFIGIQLQWLECSAASLLPERQRAPQGQKLHPPHILNEPLSLFSNICYNSKNRGGTLYAKRFR
ncbi:hypothetical protein Y693_25945 [Bacillus anthracis str. 95014]|nr:hypothetical protein Y693_25945 [Bacillus anthracis str. 95014]